MSGKWHFKTIDPGTPERNPRETEFFKLTTPTEAVVREFIQNSLDARREEIVSIRFYLGSVEQKAASHCFDGLLLHLQKCGFSSFLSQDPLSYLTIEDFGTTGLDGSTEPDADDGNFYNFWWREGISQKTGQKAGRWGIGKTTFHLVSKIRTFWGFTVRTGDEGRELLMGKALLKTHRINNERYHYFGYFSDENYEPIEDTFLTSRFKTLFNISRKTDSPGLSIVIPVPDDQINFDSLLKVVIQHYFYPILAGTLRIEINNSEKNEDINASNLIGKARFVDWSQTEWENMNIAAILEFIETAINQPDIQIQITDLNNPEITPESFGDRLNTLQQSFRSGNPMKLRVPVHIRGNDGTERKTFFTVLIRRFPEFSKAFECYIRAGIRIQEIRTLGSCPVTALLIAEDKPLCEFLGDCETPAHTNWNERSEGFKEKYRNGARILRFIKKSLNRIVSILDEPPRERQINFLKEIFSIPVAPEEKKKGRKEVIPPRPLPLGQKPLFNISQISGGFTVTFNPKRKDIKFPFRAILKMAYDTRRGNPFTQYEPFDFDMSKSPIKFKAKKCRILKKDRNFLEIEITRKNFKLEVRGFDKNRDLVVNIREVKR